MTGAKPWRGVSRLEEKVMEEVQDRMETKKNGGRDWIYDSGSYTELRWVGDGIKFWEELGLPVTLVFFNFSLIYNLTF